MRGLFFVGLVTATLSGCSSTISEPISLESDVSGDVYINEPNSVNNLLEQDGVRASIDLSEILSGGVPKDGIKPIDNPAYALVSDVPDWMNADGDGIVIERNGKARFYPYQILVSHEIVNDTFEGESLLVTYCPLCFTGIVFDPEVDGTKQEFGVSGKLWESNLLMYNRGNPESLWSQALGEAVVGPASGQKLDIVRFDITQYKKFVENFPEGEVLIGDENHKKIFGYSSVPYGGDLRNIEPIFRFSGDDDRLEKTDIVLGLIVGGKSKAYLVSALERDQSFEDVIGDRKLRVTFNARKGIAEFYDITDVKEIQLTAIPSFWISWVSIHPDTDLHK